MEIIRSNKGGRKLCYQGYLYTVKRTNQRSITWECSQKKYFNCSGSLQSDVAIETVLHEKEHCHVPSAEKIEATKLREVIRDNATNIRGNTRQTYVDATAAAPVEVRCKIGTENTVKKFIRRCKRSAFPPETTTLNELLFEGE